MAQTPSRPRTKRILVYEPLPEDLYRNAGASSKRFKICTYAEMKRICYPDLCDCPNKMPPLEGRLKIMSTGCRGLYLLAFMSTVAVATDLGLLSPPSVTSKLIDDAKDLLKEIFHTRIKAPVDSNAEYEKAVRPYNLKILWNDTVITLGDILKGLGGALFNIPKKLDEELGCKK